MFTKKGQINLIDPKDSYNDFVKVHNIGQGFLICDFAITLNCAMNRNS